MAVQAQQHASNVFYSGYPSSVLEGVQTVQDHQLRFDCFPPGAKEIPGPPNLSVFSDHPHSGLTCNVSGARKRGRDEELALAATHPVQRGSNNLSLHGASASFEIGSVAATSALLASRDQGMRVLDSAVASTSGRPPGFSFQSSPASVSFGQEIFTQICHHNLEIEKLIRFQNERFRLGLEESRRRHYKSLLLTVEQLVNKRVREKETELEDANRKNAELEEMIQQMSAQSEIWFNVAKNNEELVSNLRKDLEQVLFVNGTSTVDVPLLKEGYGDSGEMPLPAEDLDSFCFNDEAYAEATAPPTVPFPANEVSAQQMNCKVCVVDDASVLVLPCRHLCLCQNCESKVAICPICNSPKNASLQVFIS